MPPPNQAPSALPLATNRAALSNKISLLLSQRTSLLKSLTTRNGDGADKTPGATTSTSLPASTAGTTRTRRGLGGDEEDFMAAGTSPNDGVGYVRGSEDRKSSHEDTLLRGRMMLGKRKKGAGPQQQRRLYESESDSDEGRGSLGRAKRARMLREAGGTMQRDEKVAHDEKGGHDENKAHHEKGSYNENGTHDENNAHTSKKTAQQEETETHEGHEIKHTQRRNKEKKKKKKNDKSGDVSPRDN
ncbi:hypothetical protein E4U43_003286 [Claviceps pusilla]|uniref:Uncharacterized protein n=1 Tax=Claviceps pusilla TaxID=123648 RepID=A0A9P7NHX0_9HYPO|nr:hypothetical protein E4U43_003286 [Claviceps pusilla]